jgi:hypothetical protein
MPRRPVANGRFQTTNGESGQIVILTAFVMVAVLAFAGLAIDGGFMMQERRNMQNAADAMALAGASQIKADGSAVSKSAARAEALKWADNNGLTPEERAAAQIVFDESCPDRDGNVESIANSITVRIQRTETAFLMQAVADLLNEGELNTTVGACATAAGFSLGGSVGAAPFGVDQKCVYGDDAIPETNDTNEKHPGDTITIKYDSQTENGAVCDAGSGNFWLLAIDDSGAGEPCGSPVPAEDEERKLREAICFGAITPLCTPGAIEEGETCEASVDTQTGNVASIKSSLNYVLDNVPSECDTMAEIIGSTAPYAVTDICNPFLPGYSADVSLVKLIPVLDKLAGANGKTNLDIVNFLIVVIDPVQMSDADWCKSGCEISAKIVGITVNPNALRRALDDSSTNNFIVLVK